MATTASMVEIHTPDGAMPAHRSRPSAAGKYPAVLVIMEAFGLNAHMKEVADRVAAEGYVALAPDLYHREGSPVMGYNEIPAAIQVMSRLQDDQIVADVSAAVRFLRAQDFVRGERIGIMGFCMGGRVSFLSACRVPGIAASAPFYGGGIGALLGEAAKISCPMLAFFGDRDPYIPNDEVAKIRTTLAELKKQAEVILYPGADHGFFCDGRDSYHPDAARDAWGRLKTFLSAHLQS